MSKQAALKALMAIAIAVVAATPAAAQVTVPQILTIKPKCDDVAYATPTNAEIGDCKLEVIKNQGGGSGYLLSDGQKRPLRKFFDSDGDGKVDTWSFYKDGSEVYREQITAKGYSFRWLGTAGMKWGVGSVNQAGKAQIDAWRMISAEEVGAEAFAAMQTGDFDRLKALFISPQEMQAIGLPPAEMQKLAQLQQGGQAKFQAVRGKMPKLPLAKFSRLEGAQPGAYPADATGGTQDVIKASGLILFENQAAEKKHDWLMADMILVGNAWRLTDVPGVDAPPPVDPKMVELAKLIEQEPKEKKQIGPWTLQVCSLLRLIADASPADSETWNRQMFDRLATAVLAGDAACTAELAKQKDYFEQKYPGQNIAAYGSYRYIWSTAQKDMIEQKNAVELGKSQARYNEALEKFVQAYPKAEDTPDALIQLANVAEFGGNDNTAKNYYGEIVKNFPSSNNASKAAGAIRRLDCVGKQFELNGPTLQGGGFKHSPGKVTVVYYWASYSSQATQDFSGLNKLTKILPDIDVVTVNLDDEAKQAVAFLQTAPKQFTTLHMPGPNGNGMGGKLASDYGIFGLPHVFLIDAAGRVVNNKAQISTLEEEITRLTSKK